jgi:hypothetical protein
MKLISQFVKILRMDSIPDIKDIKTVVKVIVNDFNEDAIEVKEVPFAP